MSAGFRIENLIFIDGNQDGFVDLANPQDQVFDVDLQVELTSLQAFEESGKLGLDFSQGKWRVPGHLQNYPNQVAMGFLAPQPPVVTQPQKLSRIGIFTPVILAAGVVTYLLWGDEKIPAGDYPEVDRDFFIYANAAEPAEESEADAEPEELDEQVQELMEKLDDGIEGRRGNAGKHAASVERARSELSARRPPDIDEDTWDAIVSKVVRKWILKHEINGGLWAMLSGEQYNQLARAIAKKYREILNLGIRGTLALNLIHRHSIEVITEIWVDSDRTEAQYFFGFSDPLVTQSIIEGLRLRNDLDYETMSDEELAEFLEKVDGDIMLAAVLLELSRKTIQERIRKTDNLDLKSFQRKRGNPKRHSDEEIALALTRASGRTVLAAEALGYYDRSVIYLRLRKADENSPLHVWKERIIESNGH